MVVSQTGDSLAYARALTEVEGLRCSSGMQLTLAATGGHLKGRVRRLVATPSEQRGAVDWAGGLVMLAVSVGVALCGASWVPDDAVGEMAQGPETGMQHRASPSSMSGKAVLAVGDAGPAPAAAVGQAAPASAAAGAPKESSAPRLARGDGLMAAPASAPGVAPPVSPGTVPRHVVPASPGPGESIQEHPAPENATPAIPGSLAPVAPQRAPAPPEAPPAPTAGEAPSAGSATPDEPRALGATPGSETAAGPTGPGELVARDRISGGRLLEARQPAYPRRARINGLIGVVSVVFEVAEDGRMGDITIVDSTARIFERPVLKALRKWRYEPFLLDGEPVRARVSHTFQFELEADKVSMTEESGRCKKVTGSRLCRSRTTREGVGVVVVYNNVLD